MNLHDDDFSLFGLPQQFEQEGAVVDARWRELQSKVHPDRFAVEGPAAQRVALQWAVRVNEAYKRLKDSLQRAAYLCELNGTAIRIEENTAMPTSFLEQQMTWREALDDAQSTDEVVALANEVAGHRTEALKHLQITLDEKRDFKIAADQVRALMFVERFADDIDQRLEALGQ